MRRFFSLLIVVAWGGATLAVDWFAAAGVVRAVRSNGWVTADGVVTRCEVVRAHKSSRLDLAYTFTVGGREYTGHDIDAGPTTQSSDRWTRRVAALPAGTPVTVYYDSDDPAEAVLEPGMPSEFLCVPLVLTPFNVIAAGLPVAWWRVVLRRRRFDPARHVRPSADGLAVRLNGLSRLESFGITLVGLSVVGILAVFVLLHSSPALPPSWWLDGGVWVTILALSGVGAWKWGGPRRLVERGNMLTLPATPSGSKTMEVPRKAVVCVGVQTDQRRGKRSTYLVFIQVVVTGSGKSRREVRFAEYADRRDADALAGWLRGRLGLGAGE